MQVANTSSTMNTMAFTSITSKTTDSDAKGSPSVKSGSTWDDRFKSDLKERASEMLPENKKMGEFKDKKGLEEIQDLHIGPDIRYALTSKNPDFLKRLKWGGLTIGEFREITHRLRELEKSHVKNNNILKGKIIDLDS